MMMQASIVSDVAAMHGFGRAKRADSHAYLYLKPFGLQLTGKHRTRYR